MSLIPLNDNVVIERSAAQTTTASGIVLCSSEQEQPDEGIVIAVGPGKADNPISLDIGSKVLFGKYAGQTVKHRGKEYIVIRYEDIFCILT